MLKLFAALSSINVLHNYFNKIIFLIKLFLGLYLVEVLDTSAKLFFPRINISIDIKMSQFNYINCINFI